MTDEPTRYPLAWPIGRPRRTAGFKNGNFKRDGRWVSVADAIGRIQNEVRLFGGSGLLVSTNIAYKRDGMPYSNQKDPEDRGVCVYFQMKGTPYAIACDQYTAVADNLAAVAAHIAATRAITRYGVATAAETLQAFAALPPPPGMAQAAPARPQRPWREVLGLKASFPGDMDPEDAATIIRARWARESKNAHPDLVGGSIEAMAEINDARDAALKETRA